MEDNLLEAVESCVRSVLKVSNATQNVGCELISGLQKGNQKRCTQLNG